MKRWKKGTAAVWLKGNETRDSLPVALLRYGILIAIGFVYLYPIVYMVVNSFFSVSDLTDPRVTWIPRELYWGNFQQAFVTLDFFRAFGNSVLMSLVPAILQTAVCACAGFGLARFRLKSRNVWMLLIIATFILPTQVMLIPRYALFHDLGMVNTVWVQYVPALLGQGIKSAIFILVFFQYFSSYPRSFDEAAQLDGAGKLQIFLRIALPIAGSAIVLCFLFSLVWYWNETYQANYMFGGSIPTLPLKLSAFTTLYKAQYGDGASVASDPNESVALAGTLLSVLPMIVLYIACQRRFIASIEQSGITGE